MDLLVTIIIICTASMLEDYKVYCSKMVKWFEALQHFC